jgi:hypothetical protein
MAIQPHTIDMLTADPVTIYGESANLEYFFFGDFIPDTADGVTTATASVDNHTRRQYPGDPTAINVSGSSRAYLKDPSRKSGNGLPGKSFVVAALSAQGQVVEKRQFTYKGDWNDLHAVMRARAKTDMYAWNNTGARTSIEQSVEL